MSLVDVTFETVSGTVYATSTPIIEVAIAVSQAPVTIASTVVVPTGTTLLNFNDYPLAP